MSRYLEILAVQRPFPFGVDSNNRVMFSVNFEAEAASPVNAWEEEIVSLLQAAGQATLGQDTFIGPNMDLGAGDGPFINVIDTGGGAPKQTHNNDTYERLTVQIVIRAKNFLTARTRALAVWRTLHGVRNTTVTA